MAATFVMLNVTRRNADLQAGSAKTWSLEPSRSASPLNFAFRYSLSLSLNKADTSDHGLRVPKDPQRS
jgi:hypothetical protein